MMISNRQWYWSVGEKTQEHCSYHFHVSVTAVLKTSSTQVMSVYWWACEGKIMQSNKLDFFFLNHFIATKWLLCLVSSVDPAKPRPGLRGSLRWKKKWMNHGINNYLICFLRFLQHERCWNGVAFPVCTSRKQYRQKDSSCRAPPLKQAGTIFQWQIVKTETVIVGVNSCALAVLQLRLTKCLNKLWSSVHITSSWITRIMIDSFVDS